MERKILSKEYTYFERKLIIDELCEQYKFIRKITIGKSCAGRDIVALKIGSSTQYCLMTAAFHGSERITSTVLLMFIEELASAIKNEGLISGLKMPRALKERGVIFVPCINPDGCEISLLGKSACGPQANFISRLCNNDFSKWNSNFRGVDINHNFDAGWEALRELEKSEGILGPRYSQFGGFTPESEPETRALTKLCRTSKIRHVLALHSQGEVIYWSYGKNRPARSEKMAEIMATSSGYSLDVPNALATGGGFKDWFIKEFNRPGFTVEIGKGKNPLPATNAENLYLKIREMLTLCAIM